MGKEGWFSRLFGSKVSHADQERERVERKKELLEGLRDAANELDLEKMLRCANELVDLEPSNPEHWRLKARALRCLGRTPEAAECDRRADQLSKMKQ